MMPQEMSTPDMATIVMKLMTGIQALTGPAPATTALRRRQETESPSPRLAPTTVDLRPWAGCSTPIPRLTKLVLRWTLPCALTVVTLMHVTGVCL